jgi:hypothetical protein
MRGCGVALLVLTLWSAADPAAHGSAAAAQGAPPAPGAAGGFDPCLAGEVHTCYTPAYR